MTTHDVREAQLPGIGCRIVRPPLSPARCRVQRLIAQSRVHAVDFFADPLYEPFGDRSVIPWAEVAMRRGGSPDFLADAHGATLATRVRRVTLGLAPVLPMVPAPCAGSRGDDPRNPPGTPK